MYTCSQLYFPFLWKGWVGKGGDDHVNRYVKKYDQIQKVWNCFPIMNMIGSYKYFVHNINKCIKANKKI